MWCLGSVSNPGDLSLAEVVVEASLFDSTGVLLSKAAAFTQLDVVRPGESAPFAILFETPPDEFAQYHVAPVAGVPVSTEARYYFDLDTFDLRGSFKDTATYQISGQLRNFGSQDAESVRLVTVVYDKDNQVLAHRQADLAVELLRAGAVTPFEIDLIIPNGAVDHYEVLAQGLKVE